MDKIDSHSSSAALPLKGTFKPALWSKLALSLSVGPALLLFTLFFAYYFSENLALPLTVAAIFGLFFVSQGSNRSLFFSLSLPFIAWGWVMSNLAYSSGHSSDYLFSLGVWQLGLAFALMTSLFVTASGYKLSFADAETLEKEQGHLVKIAQIEAYNDRLKMIELQNALEEIKEENRQILSRSAKDAAEREAVIATDQTIIELARSEILSQHHLLEKAHADWSKIKQALARAEEDLDVAKEQLNLLTKQPQQIIEKIEYREADAAYSLAREKTLESALEEKEKQTRHILVQLEKTHAEWKQERSELLLTIEQQSSIESNASPEANIEHYLSREKALESALEEKEKQTMLILDQLEKTHAEWKQERSELLSTIEQQFSTESNASPEADIEHYLSREKALESALEEKEKQIHLILIQLEKTHAEWKNERDELINTLEQNPPEQNKTEPEIDLNTTGEESTEYRRLKGFYNQLRQQFDEKSQILDDTRKQLFITQEELYRKGLELSESESTPETLKLTEWIVQSELEKEKLEAFYKNEIESLEKLVASILKTHNKDRLDL